jgi:hypothetical protein
MRLRHAERTVATFGVVCLVSGIVGVTADKQGLALAGLIAGVAMVVFSLWAARRRI